MLADLASLAHHTLYLLPTELVSADLVPVQQIPNPPPVAPPGAQKITQVVSYIKWGAGLAIIGCFFGGLVTFAGGRLVDHHRYGRMGSTMMIASIFGALLYGIGYAMITSFAAGN